MFVAILSVPVIRNNGGITNNVSFVVVVLIQKGDVGINIRVTRKASISDIIVAKISAVGYSIRASFGDVVYVNGIGIPNVLVSIGDNVMDVVGIAIRIGGMDIVRIIVLAVTVSIQEKDVLDKKVG